MTQSEELAEILLVSEHDTWISVDPIVGCPANCTYCYLGPLNLRARRPEPQVSPAELVSKVQRYLANRELGDSYERLTRTPICFGNYTDTFMTRQNIDYFHEYAKLHAARFPSHPLCVVTKARLRYSDLRLLDTLQYPIIFFLSQSFLDRSGISPVERGPTSGVKDTLENIGMISGLRSIKAVHFLRPATKRGVPSQDAAIEVLGQIRDAGCLATVTVGLKVGPGVKLTDDQLLELLGEESTAVPGSSEVFPEDVRGYLLTAARTLQYPVYFHTSCALALATRRPEALGTWREPVRSTRCEPCQCPPAQRSRCDLTRDRASAPSATEASGLSPRFELPEGSLRWSDTELAFRLDRPVRQYMFNLIVHALPYRVVGESVEADEAWLGPFAEDRALSDDCGQWDPDELLAPGPDSVGLAMHRAIGRLRGITGFVTTLHPQDDPRPLAFARYFHVQRVVRVAEWLWSCREKVGTAPDRTKVLWLAWAHDLNRWPFAHNSERGFFDQARDVARYVFDSKISFPREQFTRNEDEIAWKSGVLQDLEGIISKRIHGLSAEGRLVLLADIIAGFVEDPLLAITGLDLSPRLIPETVREALALPLDDIGLRDQLGALNRLLYHGHDVKEFVLGFDAIFRRRVRIFARKYGLDRADPLEEKWFGDLRNILKENFLRRVLFPYNNEKVAHGLLLHNELVQPLLNVLGEHPEIRLTEIDEAGMIELALALGIIESRDQSRYFPDLDYIARDEPENSFRRTL
jgi:hypothetical protein